jgi:uncharacterized protein
VRRLALGDLHRFDADGQPFVYLVPSAAIFRLDEAAAAVVEVLGESAADLDAVAARLAPRFDAAQVREAVGELHRVRALEAEGDGGRTPQRQMPPEQFPLTTLVVNVTSRCNLACTYCYEYGEDRVAATASSQPRFIDEHTAHASVDFLLRQSGRVAHLTFFGGETLLNFPVVEKTVTYARRRAEEEGKQVDFSLTTNATLLEPRVIEFLADNDFGVTISIDGPRSTQDRFRVFHDGRGSYDVALPRIRALLARHRSRPIGARVTLTRQALDVKEIYRHLHDEVGFWEVGFAPVTTSSQREYAIENDGFDRMLAQFRDLADEYRDCALQDRHHGFSNVRDTLEELHKGMSKAYPCGAGLGLMGVSTSGDVALCHRFAGSEAHTLGSVHTGIDRGVQLRFFDRHHIDRKTDCHSCWARPLCAGGCYHEAHTRYGDTGRPNLHSCEWIRGWTDTCLRIYGELAVRNPRFLEQFNDKETYATSDAR